MFGSFSRRPAVLTAAAVVAAAASLAATRQDFSAVKITTQKVAGSVHALAGSGGNIGVCTGEEGVLIVDCQYLPLAEKIDAAIDALDDSDIRYLINTHWHGDHTGGNPHFGKEAEIVAHQNVKRRLAGDRKIGGRVETNPNPAALPEITYELKHQLKFNGEEIEVMHFPTGHTDGDSVVWFRKSNVVHTGDLFFQSGFPFIDLNSGGDVRGYLEAVEKMLEVFPEDVTVIPGHGQVTDYAGLEEYAAMLDDVILLVEEALEAGKTLNDMIDEELLGDYDERWGRSFMKAPRFLGILAEGLASESSAGR